MKASHFMTIMSVAVVVHCWSQAELKGQERLEELNCSNIYVSALTDLGESGRGVSSLAWSADGKKLLVDRLKNGMHYEIVELDLEKGSERLVNARRDRLMSGRRGHDGSPVYHPRGGMIAFNSQVLGSNEFNRGRPGYGVHNEIVVFERSSERYWPLTSSGYSSSSPRGALLPRFSPDGGRLLWTAIIGTTSANPLLGDRVLKMATLSLDPIAGATLHDETVLLAGRGRDFFEGYGFSPDGQSVLFAANLQPRQPWYGMDICVLSLDNPLAEVQELTRTPVVWDRFAAFSPQGEKIIWSSSTGYTVPNLGQGGGSWEKYICTELWIMRQNGVEKRRLTGYNNRTSQEFIGRRAIVGMSAWNPVEDKIALVLHVEGRKHELESQIQILQLSAGIPLPTGGFAPMPGRR